ncbi:DUF2470 domain-containing protein [Actinomadura craniellae]|uniref:DUF2470 domain-containing protein n=1 Tax=Actinomadura craniellae TaxID=2231787 RepID=A0A365H9X3_9ACTN|nr:DUF2470 domain-containing protein [Actinomadura craniellae]RAY15736.1 DUF2470 domain-containing protein [Actinomadura craniellae]
MSAIDPVVAPPAGPSAAELVLSVLATAGSLTLTTEGHRVGLAGLHTVTTPGRLRLDVPAGSHLHSEVAHAPGGDLAATVEFTDVAPVAVPDRVRAKVVLGGWLSPAGPGSAALCFESALINLEHDGRSTDVDPDELGGAEPDPLAAIEADLLTHLADAHGDAVELLSQLVGRRLLYGVTRVDPLRLDQYGIVLRLQRTGGTHDVRLPFPVRPRDPAHAMLQIQSLLASARKCPHTRR